jgi:hypothetical protein
MAEEIKPTTKTDDLTEQDGEELSSLQMVQSDTGLIPSVWSKTRLIENYTSDIKGSTFDSSTDSLEAISNKTEKIGNPTLTNAEVSYTGAGLLKEVYIGKSGSNYNLTVTLDGVDIYNVTNTSSGYLEWQFGGYDLQASLSSHFRPVDLFFKDSLVITKTGGNLEVVYETAA